MRSYECYLLDRSGRVATTREMEAPNDAAALWAARFILRADRRYRGFELWREDRRLAAGREAGPRPALH
jgi:hypothetical protein